MSDSRGSLPRAVVQRKAAERQAAPRQADAAATQGVGAYPGPAAQAALYEEAVKLFLDLEEEALAVIKKERESESSSNE